MDEQISQFAAVTGASADRARFFLESSGGDLQAAISTYYESEGGGTAPASAEQTPSSTSAPSQQTVSTGPRTLSGAPAEPLPAGWGSNADTSSSSRRPGAGFSAGGGRGGIRTFRDLASDGPQGGDEEDGSDDDRGPENLFTGGERSGLNVQNPDRPGRRNQPDAVKEILRQAAQNGPHPDDASTDSYPAAAPTFAGSGRTIGDDGSTPTTPTPSGSATAGVPGGFDRSDTEDEPVAVRHLNFWQDGFSIEDGPLQPYDDPRSKVLLAATEAQTAPPEAFNIKFGQRVEIRVAKRLTEKYRPPPPKPMQAFGGEGNRLGSPAPGPTAQSSSSSNSQQASSSSLADFAVDESKPVTQVQIRLGDGSRIVGRFNHDHTVADIRRYINSSQPGMSTRSYALQASFPPKVFEDESQTLKDAGLVNAVVQQKWT